MIVQYSLRRNEGRAAHGLGDDHPDVAFLLQHVIHVLRALQAARAATVPGTVLGVGGWNVLRARQQRADVLPEDRLPPNRDRVQGGAVERVPHRQRLEAAGGHAGELERDADGGRASRGEQHFAERTRRPLGQPSRQLDGRDVRVPARAEGQGLHLLADCPDHVRVPEADLVHAVAVKVEEAPALQVFQPGALAAGQDVEAGGGERLVQEVPGVLLQPVLRVVVMLNLLPRLPARRDVELAFGTQAIEVAAFHCRVLRSS